MKKISLGTKILIGFVLGIVLGFAARLVFGENAAAITAAYVTPFTTFFLNLIKMVCIPLVFSSLVVGASSTGDAKSCGRISAKTLGYFLGSTAVAVTIALALANVLRLGTNLSISTEGLEYAVPESTGFVETILNIIPTNPFESLSSGTMLQIIFFALALGLSINMVGEKAVCVKDIFVGFSEIMSKLTGLIMLYAPIAVCAMMCPTIASYGTDILKQYAAVIAAIYVGCLVHIVLVYFPTVAVFCRYNLVSFIRNCFPSFFIAFSTMSSNAALPVIMENSKNAASRRALAPSSSRWAAPCTWTARRCIRESLLFSLRMSMVCLWGWASKFKWF
ncbi:MAG TPA: hypothetical protein DF613_12390 [Lachnospiraceae bacterium]|nr:hypothetical protein [Lachnospiraceae bacterium]